MIRLWQPIYILLATLFSTLLLSQGLQTKNVQASTVDSVTVDSVTVDSVTVDSVTVNSVTVNPVTVGGRVWRDSNGDGVQGPDEAGIAEVVVVLFDVAGTLVDIGTADSFGVYAFDGLLPGRYYVIPDLGTLPPDLLPTRPNVGETIFGDGVTYDSVTDSDLLPKLGRTVPTFLIPAGGQFLSLDLGFYPLATVGGRAWHDLNSDGIQDIGEPGLADILVHLVQDPGQTTSDSLPQPLTARTDEHGYYHFSALAPGGYQLQFMAPADYRFSPPLQGSVPQLASDAVPLSDDPLQAKIAPFELSPGQNKTGLDVGLYGITSIKGFAWADSNGDGIQEPGEPLLSGVAVTLLSASHDIVATSTTTETGYYMFDGLLPGDYTLQFAAPPGLLCTRRLEQADDGATISDAEPESGQIRVRGLGLEGSKDVWVAGFTQPSVIEDRIWLDENINGQLDPEEPGLADVLIELYDLGQQRLGSTRSDSQGYFQFMGLTPGNYRLWIHHPAGYYFTERLAKDEELAQVEEGTSGVNQISSAVTISQVDPASGISDIVALRPGLQSGFASAGLVMEERPQVVEPTAVEVMAFDAQLITTSTGGIQVLLSWDTLADAGDGAAPQYMIYRSVFREDAAHRTEDRVVVAQVISESSTGMDEYTHQWIDDSVLYGFRYRYWLVSVIEGQAGAEFGPIEVHPVQLADISSGRQVFLPLIYGY